LFCAGNDNQGLKIALLINYLDPTIKKNKRSGSFSLRSSQRAE
jgi:hypothetical protein